MRLLVLGGTVFLGRHLVEAALARGDEVTLFNRGLTAPELHPGAEHLRGDRDGDLDALRGREWDAVVDTSGFVPRVVRASAEALAASAGRYLFVSSISVYADLSTGPGEASAVATLDDPASEDVDAHYGALKAACETVVQDVLGDRALVVRPGLIVGPHDPTGRFTYWPVRLARGGEVLAPKPASASTQVIDVRDLAAWMLELLDRGLGGTFNATGPTTPFAGLLEACRPEGGPETTLTWVDPGFLLDAGVTPWTELPLWLPGEQHAGLGETRIDRALAAGLTLRPLAETARDTLAWARTLAVDPPRQQDGRYRVRTLTPERERELLAAWHAR